MGYLRLKNIPILVLSKFEGNFLFYKKKNNIFSNPRKLDELTPPQTGFKKIKNLVWPK